jgi:hypothetical protein
MFAARALKAMFGKLRLQQTALTAWNIDDDLCTGSATNGTDIDNDPNRLAVRCDCADQNNTVCHITKL